jgi:serine phosphatase RsbU (regulator of sigma subunit)
MFRLSSPQFGSRYDWQLKPGTYIAGRDPQADFFVNDSTVSRKHAQIEVVDEQTVRLTDLGSTNGTLVNDRKVAGTVPLKPGDTVTFGNVGFLFAISTGTPSRRPELSIIDTRGTHASMSALSLDEALVPLALQDSNDPKIFKAISDMAKMLILPQTVDDMFDKALDMLQGIISAERAAIFLAKEGSEEVTLANYRLANLQSSDSFTISRSIVHAVLTDKNAVFFSDLIVDERFTKQESIMISGIRSAMAVPLIDEQKVLGILYADTTDPAHRYSEETTRLTATFGNILAAKITNHNLLQERQAKQALEAELNIASQIQEGLMPKVLPVVPGYRFHAFQAQCKMVGGDLYDVAELPGGRILFLLGDVSGKGMGAALLASNILSAFRILRDSPVFDPAEVTARVSNQLHHSSRSGDFATIFLGILDPQTHQLTYVNAGHNSPLLVRADGRLEHVDATGIPMGIFGEFVWEAKPLTLECGDRLLVFTDGIPEAMDAESSFYTDERLEKFAIDHHCDSLDTFTITLIDDVDKFSAGAPRCDDMTVIILAREG